MASTHTTSGMSGESLPAAGSAGADVTPASEGVGLLPGRTETRGAAGLPEPPPGSTPTPVANDGGGNGARLLTGAPGVGGPVPVGAAVVRVGTRIGDRVGPADVVPPGGRTLLDGDRSGVAVRLGSAEVRVGVGAADVRVGVADGSSSLGVGAGRLGDPVAEGSSDGRTCGEAAAMPAAGEVVTSSSTSPSSAVASRASRAGARRADAGRVDAGPGGAGRRWGRSGTDRSGDTDDLLTRRRGRPARRPCVPRQATAPAPVRGPC